MADERVPGPADSDDSERVDTPARTRIETGARKAGEALGSINPYSPTKYPHNIHPALVPGIGIDEQRRHYSIDKAIVGVAGALTVAFVIWGVTHPENVGDVADVAYSWVMAHAGWLFTGLATAVLVFLLVIAFSGFGRIPLGKDGETPEFSTFAWVSMLFAAGIGIGVLFWGPAEPLTYFLSPPPHTYEAGSVEALHGALAQTFFHWGFHAWAIYALIGGAVAYAAYRRGRVLLISSIFRTLFGSRHSDGVAGRLVDGFAIIATLFGTASGLGIAALQIGQGVTIIGGASELTNTVLIIIIAALTIGVIVSAVSGVARGIRYLSSLNIILTIGVVGVFFLLGPSLFLLNLVPSAIIEYFGSLPEMMGRSASWGEETLEFQSTWTVYYWAWWVSWSPFVGIFIARISRGRTIRQFILGVILIPSSLLFLAYGVMGGVSMWQAREGYDNIHADLTAPEVLFSVIDNLPYAGWLPAVAIVILAIFFITAADSASVVSGILSTQGNQDPPKAVVLFWGLVMSGIALVMLTLGGATALWGLQSLVTVTALPFAIITLLVMVAWVKDLRTDPLTLRRKYAEKALGDAVLDGVDRYGDDFSLEVSAAEPGRGAGSVVESDHPDYTEWYQRTDEHGRPVEYDFQTGEWEDGWRPSNH